MRFNFLKFLKLFLFLAGSYSANSVASFAPNVWDVLRSQLILNHEVTQPEVQSQLQWLIAHPGYIQKLARSEPYIYHIVTEVRKRQLPGELALLPMLESAYDPFAYSGVGAAGLWQLMPGTGNDLGLKQDWWFDGRRSIRPSTDAALNYLTYLNKYFNGNWLLAIAAYDSGEGTMSRAIKNSGRTRNIRFWDLQVPKETRAYVPKLLALAEIIKYPQRYHVTLPKISHIPYFEEVNIGSQIDLNHAAKLAGMSYKDLIKLNPGFNRWATAPYKPFNLLIPTDKVAHFNRNLANLPKEKRVSFTRHSVKEKENIDNIARQYFTTPKLIRELNQLKTNKLKIGQSILIPSSKNTTVLATRPKQASVIDRPVSIQSYKVVHIVQQSDSFETLSKKYNVSSTEIRDWNKLNPAETLKKGSQLIIWKRSIQYGLYIVKAGDNLSRIAQKNNTKVSVLTRLNPQIASGILKPGQQIIIG